MPLLSRARGTLLRIARRRRVAMALGAALAAPAAWIEFFGEYDAWWVEGLALVVGATGIALMWTGLVGVAPDWVDDDGAASDPGNDARKSAGKDV